MKARHLVAVLVFVIFVLSTAGGAHPASLFLLALTGTYCYFRMKAADE